ncbi:MFS general substrate transporter [Microthyrium microscopicum]|uniref:MFS general substrate transporter n=1 Tax=Microthyrium microscopicum TaxID=703497 RepID=A0A6A6UUP5_9PEZI|nr:MFS general substrate transporter [Microthyrium microscopicum]
MKLPNPTGDPELGGEQNVYTGNDHKSVNDHRSLVADSDPGDPGSSSTNSEAQEGVKKIEAISSNWTKWGLIIAYASLLTIANATSLEGNTTISLAPFATSAFLAHSLLATVTVVQGTVNAVIKPPMAKIADVFGRFEAFSIAIFLFTVGYIQQAASNNVRTYAAAQIFYSAGSQGLQILQQIFVADTSDLLNRALYSSLFDVPFLWTVWVGPDIAQSILTRSTWRWGYGIWAIVLPVAFIPLAVVLLRLQIKLKRQGKLPPNPFAGKAPFAIAKELWFDLDIFGLLLLAAAIALILIPLTLANSAKDGYRNGSIIAMLVMGGVCFVAFPFWERSSKLAPHAFFPPNLFNNRTVIAGVAIAFFYFMAFYLSIYPYFSSYLLIVQGKSVKAAGHITQVFTFTSTVTSILIALCIKYTAHYKYYITAGSCIYLLGMGLLIRYRSTGVSTATLVGCQIAVGIGGGMLNVPAQLGVQAAVSHQQVAAATAAFLTILEIGGAVGAAISGAVWSHFIPLKLKQYAPESIQNQTAAIYGNVTLASTGWAMGTPERDAIARAYQETMTILLTIAVCVCIPLIPLSLVMKNYKLDQMDQKVKGVVIGSDKRSEESTQTDANTQ